MSRNSKIVDSPVVKTFKWKNAKQQPTLDSKGKPVKDEKGKTVMETVGKTGWSYYDKTLNDNDGANVFVDFPSFVWLETSFSIAGYNKEAKMGVYSNEVLNLKTQPLTVKMGTEVVVRGLYQDIKKETKGIGGKFCNAVYALMKNDDGEYEVVRFLMYGASGGAWMEFNNRTKNKTNSIISYDKEEKFMETGGSFEAPLFKYMPLSKDDAELADKVAQEQIDPFFDYMLNTKIESKETPVAMTEDNSDY